MVFLLPQRADAEAMFLGRRKIIDGEYAVLAEKDDEGETITDYFKRVNNEWVEDNSISPSLTDVTQKGLCDSDPGCFNVNEDCVDRDEAIVNIESNQLESMVDTFAEQAQWEAKVTEVSITEDLGHSARTIQQLTRLAEAQKLKYDVIRYSIGLEAEETEEQSSPHFRLLQLILGQSDFAKRQHDILRFSNKFTREAKEGENRFWRYCIESNAQLLPTFFTTLASAFVVNNDYYAVLSRVCAEHAQLATMERPGLINIAATPFDLLTLIQMKATQKKDTKQNRENNWKKT